ncbi:MAG: hypothetical protein HQM03_12050 [Magnetococcales bacterium]|nr:hypothetical protein [Magnetococcales bacterium]
MPDPCVTVSPGALRAMIRLARALRGLSLTPGWREAIRAETPASFLTDPGNEAVMMGYDFHLTPNGPRLIEVNTNAGGGLMAHRALAPDFPPGPEFPEGSFDPGQRHQRELLATFGEEMALFSGGAILKPSLLVILDEAPEEQFLYPEMRAFAALLTAWGCETVIADPAALEMNETGVFLQSRRVEMIYNRHCDFYLESAALAGLAAAWRNRRVCLSPNPRQYGLLADKRRMILWSDAEALANLGLSAPAIAFLTRHVPKTRLLATLDPAQAWRERNQSVFKPIVGFGSKGVLLGAKISRVRFNELDPATTLVQQFIPPSLTRVGETTLKTDIRLFFYRDRPLGVAARVYQGQVTNFRLPGNGFLSVRVMRELAAP